MYTQKQYKNLKTMTNEEVVKEKQTLIKEMHELEKKYLSSSLIAITSVDAPMYVDALNRLEKVIKEIKERIENEDWYF